MSVITTNDFGEFARFVGEVHVSEFIDIFFDGNAAQFAKAMNVSRQAVHKWINDEESNYCAKVIYAEFDNGKKTYDYCVTKQVKRVGAASNEFVGRLGCVYAVSNGSITKVGCSRNPDARIKYVAKKLGFDEYDSFVSNITDEARRSEAKAHKALSQYKFANDIFPREVFSCSLSVATTVIESSLMDICSGPRQTPESLLKALGEKLKTKLIGE